jgi:SAM-dependent methyltransferase
MLDLAGIRAGSRVLDVAAGTGDQSLEAAQRTGPTGSVLATDLSASMLAAAAKAAADGGFRNIEARVADAQALDLEPESFDAAICRAGLMFFPDRQKALAGIRHALKPGARFAAVVWSDAERNPFLALPLDVVEPRCDPSQRPPMLRIALSMGQPGLLEETLAAVGFTDILVRAVPANRHASSVDEMMATMRSGSGASETVNLLPESEREAAWQEIAAGLRRFEGPQGIDVPGELLAGVGRK